MDYSGEYYLTGVMETGCGINLKSDHTFDFFYAYGALDRHGYGTWKETDTNEIELNTSYGSQTPFTISKEENRNHSGIIIFFPDYNKILLRETKINIFKNGIEEEQISGDDDKFRFKIEHADKIVVTCLFYFDNTAQLVPANADSNYFEILPNQNLPLTHFKNAKYRIEENALIGKFHLLDDFKKYRFEK
ncbi:MAG: hypothetical protein H7Y00_03595 [Fimbriimonadaceae bacterium]|nr:hypothetical protein [Chitinophagales bacterium]